MFPLHFERAWSLNRGSSRDPDRERERERERERARRRESREPAALFRTLFSYRLPTHEGAKTHAREYIDARYNAEKLDVWGLACIVFEMCEGPVVFEQFWLTPCYNTALLHDATKRSDRAREREPGIGSIEKLLYLHARARSRDALFQRQEAFSRTI